MSNIDIKMPVKFKNPFEGEENLVYRITNLNEITGRCYIRLINSLPGISSELAPEELVSIDDLVNIE